MVCSLCHRRMESSEPVHRYRGRTEDPLGSLYDRRLTMCADCFSKTWYSKLPGSVSPPRPCKGCGRTVVDCFSYWKSTFCNEWCRLAYYRAEAKQKRALTRGKKTCPACAQSFTPKRSDSR